MNDVDPESPELDPMDELCRCGHSLALHDDASICIECICVEFVPTDE